MLDRTSDGERSARTRIFNRLNSLDLQSNDGYRHRRLTTTAATSSTASTRPSEGGYWSTHVLPRWTATFSEGDDRNPEAAENLNVALRI